MGLTQRISRLFTSSATAPVSEEHPAKHLNDLNHYGVPRAKRGTIPDYLLTPIKKNKRIPAPTRPVGTSAVKLAATLPLPKTGFSLDPLSDEFSRNTIKDDVAKALKEADRVMALQSCAEMKDPLDKLNNDIKKIQKSADDSQASAEREVDDHVFMLTTLPNDTLTKRNEQALLNRAESKKRLCDLECTYVNAVDNVIKKIGEKDEILKQPVAEDARQDKLNNNKVEFEDLKKLLGPFDKQFVDARAKLNGLPLPVNKMDVAPEETRPASSVVAEKRRGYQLYLASEASSRLRLLAGQQGGTSLEKPIFGKFDNLTRPFPTGPIKPVDGDRTDLVIRAMLEMQKIDAQDNEVIDRDERVNFVIGILMSATGIYTEADLGDQAKELHNAQGSEFPLHFLAAKNILRQFDKLSQLDGKGNASKKLVIDFARVGDARTQGNIEGLLGLIEQRYSINIDLNIVGFGPISNTLNTISCKSDDTEDKVAITLYQCGGKYRPLTIDNSDFNPALSPDKRLKWKSYTGLITSKYVDWRRPERKNVRKMTDKELIEKHSLLNKRSPKTTFEIEVDKEFYKRQVLAYCSKGLHRTLPKGLGRKSYRAGQPVFVKKVIDSRGSSNILQDRHDVVRYSDWSYERLESAAKEIGPLLHGLQKRDFLRALAVARAAEKMVKCPSIPQPRIIVPTPQIRNIVSSFNTAISDAGALLNNPLSERDCNEITSLLEGAYLFFEEAISQGNLEKLNDALERCTQAQSLLIQKSQPAGATGVTKDRLEKAGDPDIDAKKELQKLNYVRCLKLVGTDDSEDIGKFLSVFEAREEIRETLLAANGRDVAFNENNPVIISGFAALDRIIGRFDFLEESSEERGMHTNDISYEVLQRILVERRRFEFEADFTKDINLIIDCAKLLKPPTL
ncbi:MAG: hypothetical protein V4695_02440 [Pseudomonadota bacterium]